ncbi:MAG TPA: hypothetical protein VGO93_11965 [Candidatus Xenobia bacterium]|jgi:hypothetical protein
MNKLYPTLIVGGLALAAAIGSYHPAPTPLSSDEALQTLEGRAWVDRTSGTPRDPFNVYLFGQRNRGGYAKADSSFRYHVDLDLYRVKDNTIQFRFLHDNKRVETTFTITRLERPINGRDLKLQLSNDPMVGGEHIYYSIGEQKSADLSLDAVPTFDDGQDATAP